MCNATASPRHAEVIPRPRWFFFYGVTSILLGSGAAVELFTSPGAARMTLRVGLAVGALATLSLWFRFNRVSLDLEDWCDCAREKTTVRVILSDVPEPPVTPMPVAPEPWRHEPIEEAETVGAVTSVRRSFSLLDH